MLKRLGGNTGCKDNNGFPDFTTLGSTVYCIIGEESTITLYTYTNRHAGTPKRRGKKHTVDLEIQ